MLYTSLPGRPVHSGTNFTSLGRFLATQQLRTTTTHSHFHHRLSLLRARHSTTSYRAPQTRNTSSVIQLGENLLKHLPCHNYLTTIEKSLEVTNRPLFIYVHCRRSAVKKFPTYRCIGNFFPKQMCHTSV